MFSAGGPDAWLSCEEGCPFCSVLVVVTFATFLLIYGNGPGFARNVLGGSTTFASQAEVHAEMVKLGLDRPLYAQYGSWFKGA